MKIIFNFLLIFLRYENSYLDYKINCKIQITDITKA